MTSNSNKNFPNGGVVLHGYHKKLKTMKKKYFVLYGDIDKSLARLEYFDNEKKFRSKANPKRTIILNSCFNINRRLDTKHAFVITLSTKEGGFGIVMDTEEDMNKWLRAMLEQIQTGDNILSSPPKPFYEHVWQVVVQRKGLAEKKGILGNYHVCLSSKSITLIRIGSERTNIGETRVPLIEFYLTSIRRCGDSKCYFYMEVGRHSVIGAGELWMETEDSLIAQNMHTMILNVMSKNAEYGPMRKRSSSANETSKPVNILQRRQTHSGSKTMNSSPLSAVNRDRCDSLPSSRNRTTTESSYNSGSMPPSSTMTSLSTVPNSIHNRHSHSPPMNTSAFSPSVGCSESDGSTLSIDETDSMKQSLTADENTGFISRFYNSPGGVIPEENSDEFWYNDNKKLNCVDTISDDLIIQVHAVDPRKTLSSSSNIHGTETKSQYVDMGSSISPCETALCDTNLAGAECAFKSCNDSSDGNSRTSSIAEEVVDGYVNMSSPRSTDYVDMEQSMKSRRHYNLSGGRVPTAGIPLKMCFDEYPLEKVSSGIFPDEDESQVLNERPPRAYSVGSRIEHNNQKLRIEVIANSEQNNSRVRAFSVGSRSKVPTRDLQRNVLLAANSCSSNNSNASNSKSSVASMEPASESAGRGRKSSSAPLLIHKSQNSVDRMDDLMEIDFSKNSSSRSNSLSSQSAGTSSHLGNLPKGSHLRSSILSSSPGQSSINKSHDSFSELSQHRADNGYLEMRPVIYSTSAGSHDESMEHMPVLNDSSITEFPETHSPDTTTHNKLKIDDRNKIETPEGYLEMSWNGNKDSNYSNVDHVTTNNKHLINDFANACIKSRTSSLLEAKKSRAATKMPSTTTPSHSMKNNRTPATGNHSKLTLLHSQNLANSQKCTLNVPAKSEPTQRKRYFDHGYNAFTISEEKVTGTDQDTTISEKFQNLLINQQSNNNDLPNAPLDLSADDFDCYDCINCSAGITKQVTSPKKSELDSAEREKPQDTDNKAQQSVEVNCKQVTSNLKDSSSSEEATKLTRKSNSPKCTPTSPHSSSLRCHRYSIGNTSRQTKGSTGGYELLHICSDSSLQTRKNSSRPSSVNSDRISPPDATQSRPNSVNSDLNSSSSTATLCFSSPKSSDNRSQDPLLTTAKSVPVDDNKQKSADSVSSKGIVACNDFTTSPVSKCQPPVAVVASAVQPELALNYASLDLPVSSIIKNSITTVYGSLVNPARSSTSDDTSVSLSPNSNTSQQSTFTYAKIDFNQCENKKFKCGTQNNL